MKKWPGCCALIYLSQLAATEKAIRRSFIFLSDHPSAERFLLFTEQLEANHCETFIDVCQRNEIYLDSGILVLKISR